MYIIHINKKNGILDAIYVVKQYTYMITRVFSSKIPVLLPLILFGALSGLAQGSRLSTSAGDVVNFHQTSHGILIRTTRCWASIQVYSPTMIRVRMSHQVFSSDFSYAVIGKPDGEFTKVQDSKGNILLLTDSLEVRVNKDPLQISFYTRGGKMLSGDYGGLGVRWLGHEITDYRTLLPGEKFIGLGEKTGNLNRRGNHYVNWNTDAFGYSLNRDPIYSTMPFYLGIHDSLTYGIFFDNTFRSFFDFGSSTDSQFCFFGADDGEMNYYFFGASTIRGILQDYSALTGHIHMPPLWSLGYQQSRYSYMSSKELLGIARTFREKQIPCDVLYCDIDYMDHYKVFTWNPVTFPDPREMTDSLKMMGFHLVTIIDPGIKVEKGYPAFDEGMRDSAFARYPDGSYYTGSVWAGRSHFPDFTRRQVRTWWGKNFSALSDSGVTGFWNDMNEPSAWGQDIPDLIEFGNPDHRATLASVRNVYGMQMARATYNGTRKLLGGRRPFVLSRAAYSGIQRYSAMWTGDNNSTDEHMLLGYRLINSMGLSGEPFVGMDIGGFSGNPTPALMVRWMSLGTYTPMFRNHTAKGNTFHEPWRWGKKNEALMRKSIRQRYRLLPYLYSTFYEASRNGMPVERSLAIDYAYDQHIYRPGFENEFQLGHALLVAPVVSYRDSAKVYFPKCGWYRMSTGDYIKGGHAFWVAAPLNDLPVFVRAGSIIPMQHPVQSTMDKGDGVLQIHVWYGTDPSSFRYYEDDGNTYQYEQGVFYRRLISFDPEKHQILFAKPTGSYSSRFTQIKLVLHGFPGLISLKLNDRVIHLQPGRQSATAWAVFPNKSEKLSINW